METADDWDFRLFGLFLRGLRNYLRGGSLWGRRRKVWFLLVHGRMRSSLSCRCAYFLVLIHFALRTSVPAELLWRSVYALLCYWSLDRQLFQLGTDWLRELRLDLLVFGWTLSDDGLTVHYLMIADVAVFLVQGLHHFIWCRLRLRLEWWVALSLASLVIPMRALWLLVIRLSV